MKPHALVPVVLALAVASLALAQGMEHHAASSSPSALEPLRKLAGTWTGTAGSGEQKMDATVTYKVTANGSAVMETLFPGTEHEMVTMYTTEKGALVLTHYCAAGNQPHMKARKGAAANELVFDFAGGANIDPKKDMFMHDAKLVFVDDDHLRSEWRDWNAGKPGALRTFDLTRRK